MPFERVWSRFEVKKKDGTVLKLRTQDVPRARVEDAVDIIMSHFFAEEVLHKAVGLPKDAESHAIYKKNKLEFTAEPLSSIVICCADEDEVKEIMGVSLMIITADSVNGFSEQVKDHGTPTMRKLKSILGECKKYFNPVKEYGLNKFYDDRGLCVVPEYRGLGISTQLIGVRKLMCKAHGIPMAGGWITAYGTQKAAAKIGWKTVKEISFDYLGKKHGVTFVDAPPTMKYMLGDYSNSKSKL